MNYCGNLNIASLQTGHGDAALMALNLHLGPRFLHHKQRSAKAIIMAGDNTLNFTDNAFDQDVLNSEVPVLVDFWAPWCGPCRAMAPTIDAVADEYIGKAKIGKMNTDDNPGTAQRFQIRGIPTLLLFKGGKVVDQRVGAMPKPEVKKMLDAQLTS